MGDLDVDDVNNRSCPVLKRRVECKVKIRMRTATTSSSAAGFCLQPFGAPLMAYKVTSRACLGLISCHFMPFHDGSTLKRDKEKDQKSQGAHILGCSLPSRELHHSRGSRGSPANGLIAVGVQTDVIIPIAYGLHNIRCNMYIS